ncbi:MAG TPA: hypothetical protein ENJ00_01520 [Phycisphaerales bacterium]|nr:hypothetical protein [Phycisphaerales bacterium]
MVVDVALVHRRLSIIDHKGGYQPMVHDGKRLREDLTYQPGDEPKLAHELATDLPLVGVVFNGCVYNHRVLRTELESSGCKFETDHSDTEVVVHGWRAWGAGLPQRLDSMHVAGIWDRVRGALVLTRDQTGQKPVYVIEMGPGLFAFASEAGALRASKPVSHVSSDRLGSCSELKHWLRFGWGKGMLSPSGGQVPPDGFMEVDSEHVSRLRSVQKRDRPKRGTDDLSEDRVQRLIRDAVRSCSDADVPIALLLSGGVDSGLLAGVSAELGLDISAVTVRMPADRCDESSVAAEIASHTGLRHHIVGCDSEPADDLVRLIHRLGLPFADSSLLPTYWACRAAAEVGKVTLVGDGGDELFAGYLRHTVFQERSIIRSMVSHVPSGLFPARDPSSRLDKLGRFSRAAKHGGYPDLLSIFDTEMLARLTGQAESVRGSTTGTCVDGPQYDFMNYLPHDLLRKSDTASMAVPIELRAPLLSRPIVNACLATPLNVLMPGGERKGLLKRVARRYLPNHIVDRPKRGFAIPVGQWFRSDYGSMRTLLYDHLQSSNPFPGLADAGVEINMEFIRQMLREHDAAGGKSINPWHGRDHSQRLYLLLVLSIWTHWIANLGRSAGIERR